MVGLGGPLEHQNGLGWFRVCYLWLWGFISFPDSGSEGLGLGFKLKGSGLRVKGSKCTRSAV